MSSATLNWLILLLFAVTMCLSFMSNIKPHKHVVAYCSALFFVSLPFTIWAVLLKDRGTISIPDGVTFFGAPISLICMLFLLPFVGIYVWGLIKKFVSDSQIGMLIPIIVVGLLAGLSLFMFFSANGRNFTKMAGIAGLVAAVVMLFSGLIYTVRFWSYQILVFSSWLILVFIIGSIGSFSVNTSSMFSIGRGLMNIENLVLYFSFVNLFLVVFNWFDIRHNTQAQPHKNTSSAINNTPHNIPTTDVGVSATEKNIDTNTMINQAKKYSKKHRLKYAISTLTAVGSTYIGARILNRKKSKTTTNDNADFNMPIFGASTKPEHKLDLRKIPSPPELFRSDTNSFSAVNVPTGTSSSDKTTSVSSEISSEQAEVLRKSSKLDLNRSSDLPEHQSSKVDLQDALSLQKANTASSSEDIRKTVSGGDDLKISGSYMYDKPTTSQLGHKNSGAEMSKQYSPDNDKLDLRKTSTQAGLSLDKAKSISSGDQISNAQSVMDKSMLPTPNNVDEPKVLHKTNEYHPEPSSANLNIDQSSGRLEDTLNSLRGKKTTYSQVSTTRQTYSPNEIISKLASQKTYLTINGNKQ